MPAARSSLPSRLAPQLCAAAHEPPRGDAWVHEIKYDGWRLMARKVGPEVRLFTRGGHDWTGRLPSIARAVAALRVRSAWLDGELVVLDDDGVPDFEALPGAMRAAGQPRLFFHLWDAPWWNGRDISDRSLSERKSLLEAGLHPAPARLRFSRHLVGDGPEVFAQVNALDLEGIVSKRAASRYAAGERRTDWRKVKCWLDGTFVVGGVARDGDGRTKALLVGTPAVGGLRYEGRVELGLRSLGRRWVTLQALRASECPFHGTWAGERVDWVRPELAVDLRALPRRPGRALRHAVLLAETTAAGR